MTDDGGPGSAVHAGDDSLESEYARRSVLRGALALGAVGIGGALTGCGGGSSSSTSSTTAQASTPVTGTNTAAAPAAPAAAPAATAAKPAAPAAAPAAAGTSLGLANKVPVGGGVIYGAAKVVVTQPTAGDYKAFGAICTHQTCLLADVSDGTINCACHGSKFSITDGSALKPPAVDPLPVKKVTISGGKVFVT
jgi:nitrite reductase/ring-hydroxylating ferredoxin subunit